MILETFERCFLPDAKLEVILLADTHHLLDAQMYATPGDSQSPELMREWGARAGWALELATALETELVFHVGDLQQEYPDNEHFEEGRLAAKGQLERSGLRLSIAAGNMDIGDKSDPTMPASWVSAETLKRWEEDFGPSFHSFSSGDCVFVFLNSQIFNSELQVANDQKRWFEDELEKHSASRVFVLLHMPPFLVDEGEPGLGSYDAIGEPARTWLLDLCRSYEIEAVFAGHTHFRLFNRVEGTRIYCLPSTTTTRPGFYEAFSVLPSHQGKADLPKLGFTVLRILDQGHVLHLVRTNGEVSSRSPGWSRLMTCTTREIPASPLGAFLRLPLAAYSDGAVGYPYQVRHRVRDDYPLLACLELGLRSVRFPIHDLWARLQEERLEAMRGEGVSLTAMVIWDGAIEWERLERALPALDVIEVQLPGHLVPSGPEAETLSRLDGLDIEVALSPILIEDIGLVHRRGRSGFRPEELPGLDEALSSHEVTVDRAVCVIEPDRSPWEAITAFTRSVMTQVRHLDFVLMADEREKDAVVRITEAMLAAACIENCRLFIDPLQDSDRTAAVSVGLLDRLSNPRTAFEAAKAINTVLFGGRSSRDPVYRPLRIDKTDEASRVIAIGDRSSTIWSVTGSDRRRAAEAIHKEIAAFATRMVVDPGAGRSRRLSDGLPDLAAALSEVGSGLALVVGRGKG